MAQQRGGKRLASREKQRVRRGNPFILPSILGVLVLVLLGIKLALPQFLSSAPTPPDWVTQELLEVNPFSRPGTKLEEVTGIVVHYVGNPGTTAEQNRSFFAGLAQQEPAAEGEPDSNTYASSHFLIGLDGEIIQCIPLDEWSYCTSQRNKDTISIECCHPDEEGAFTEATYQSLLKLVHWLQEEFHLSTDQVIRHYDVTGKECPRYYVEHPEQWEQFKADLDQMQD